MYLHIYIFITHSLLDVICLGDQYLRVLRAAQLCCPANPSLIVYRDFPFPFPFPFPGFSWTKFLFALHYNEEWKLKLLFVLFIILKGKN